MPEAAPLWPELSCKVSALAGDAADRWRVWGDARPGLVSLDRTSLTALTALKRATYGHASDLFSPQVEILLDRLNEPTGHPSLVNTWEPSGHGDFRCGVGEGIDPGAPGLAPSAFT